MKLFAAGALALSSVHALAGVVNTVDFDSLVHGEILNSQFAGQGLNLSFTNPNRSFDIGAAFDTTLTGTADPDLEDPWDSGNIASSEILGRVMIISQTNAGASTGILSNPNDEGSRPAGTITAQFDQAIISFGFDVIDIEGAILEASSIEFFIGATLVNSYTFGDFQTRDASVVFGNNSANRIAAFTAAEVGGAFDRVVFNVGGSSAYDNFNWVVPTPGSIAMLGLGGLVAMRRRR